MKNLKTKIIILAALSLFAASAYSLEKATIYFKSGEKLDCIVDKYETGKWVDIIDETGSRKTIKWDVINLVYFKNEETVQENIAPVAEPAVTQNEEAVDGSIEVQIETVPEPAQTEPEPMNLAQRLAKKERERKEQEALAAKKSAADAEAAKAKKEVKEVKKTEVPAASKNIAAEPVKPAQVSDTVKNQTQEKATIYYKNGDKLNCDIESYELGKYAVVVDDTGNKRIISWDNINEIVFIKKEETPKAMVQYPVQPPAAAPVTAAPVIVSSTGDSGSKSMLGQFQKKQAESAVEEPANSRDEKFKQDIREENKAQKPVFDFDKESKKLSLDYYQTLESDATRRAWIEDGGMLKSKSMTGNYTYMSMDMGDTDFSMHGFGFSYSGALKFINPPNYATGKNLWNAFTIGAGGSFNIAVGSMEMENLMYDYYSGTWYYQTTEMNMTNLTYDISANIGYTFGLGKYLSSADWKGVMLGIYWKPNFTMSKSTTEIDGTFYDSDPTSSFNAAGMQWTIDWGDFGAMADRIAQEAHFTISGFILPKTDETPFLFSIGMGAVWY
jgi:sRNA-binding regulator protein Hfq